MTLKQHRLIQWIAITLILSLGAGYYYQTKVQGAQTIAAGETPSFQADLKNTLDLQKGVGKPTFTRATTASVTDFEGLIKQAKSGEARFDGARRVENLITYSEDFGGSGWSPNLGATRTISQLDPYGGYSAVKVTSTNYASGYFKGVSTIATGRSYIISVWLKGDVGGEKVKFFEPSPGGTVFTLTTTWKRYSTGVIIAANSSLSLYSTDAGTKNWYVHGVQLEDVTGQANQNPSEYVSTNVLTAAPYHGANVDGVKYFTTQNGNTVASNVVTEATGAAIPDATLKGYLAEGQRTNLLHRSEEFDNAAWNKTNATITADATVAPDGKSTADKFIESANTGSHSINISSSNAAGALSISLYVKAAELTTVDIGIYNSSSVSWVAKSVFNLSTGTISSTLLGTAFIQALNNGWYRVTVSGTSLASNSSVYLGANQSSHTGDGTSGIYLWGAQLEQASFASSYIPTTTASVTRNADILYYPTGGNISIVQGSVYTESYNTQGTIGSPGFALVMLTITDNTYNNVIGHRVSTGTFTTNSDVLKDGVSSRSSASPLATNAFNKIATAYISGRNAISLNSSSVVSSNLIAPPISLTRIDIGSDHGVGAYAFGTIRNVKIWKKALTDAQLTNMTSATDAVANSAVKKTTINAPQNDKLTNGLVGFWSFNGLDMSGTTAYDRSGSNNHGTLTNGPARAIGKVGQALSFDGVNDFVNLGASSSSVKTVAFWIKPSSTTQSILDLNGTQTIDIAAGTVRGNSFTSPTIYVDGAATSALSTTDWHHIAITTGTNINASAFAIGKIASSYLSGKIDEVRIYNRALSAGEVQDLYQMGR